MSIGWKTTWLRRSANWKVPWRRDILPAGMTLTTVLLHVSVALFASQMQERDEQQERTHMISEGRHTTMLYVSKKIVDTNDFNKFCCTNIPDEARATFDNIVIVYMYVANTTGCSTGRPQQGCGAHAVERREPQCCVFRQYLIIVYGYLKKRYYVYFVNYIDVLSTNFWTILVACREGEFWPKFLQNGCFRTK